MDLETIKDCILGFLLTGLLTVIIKELKELRDAIDRLNLSVAVGLERVEGHDKRLNSHKLKITNLEEKILKLKS
jgi:hypothetical protein